MQKAMVRIAGLALLLGGVAAFAQQPAAPPKPAPDKKAETPPNPLDDLIAKALQYNPDIRVAEAKVREAEAELQRIRVATAQKVAALHQAIETARQSRETAKKLFETIGSRHATGHASQEEFFKAEGTFRLAAAEVLKLEAEMPGLLGKMPGKLGQQKAEATSESGADPAASRALTWLAVQQAVQSGQTDTRAAAALALSRIIRDARAEPEGSIADIMRKALDKPINIEVANKPLNEVLEKITELLDRAITFRIAPAKARDGATVFHATTLVSVHFTQTPAGAVLQALNDSVPALAFVVRDYGVLVCETDSLPPDAVLLHRFWKSGVAESDMKTPPADDLIGGEVTEVDEKSGLVRIGTNGGDKGLAKGHTLEVYREGPKPLYLGTIRILDVGRTTAVGKPIGKTPEAIKKGDKVTSKLTGK